MSAYISSFSDTYGANVFKRDTNKTEYLTEIGISNLIDSNYEIYVNPNNSKLTSSNLIKVAQTEKLTAGYHTIELETPVKLTGTEFAIVVKYINRDKNSYTYFGIEKKISDSDYWANAKNSDGESFLSSNMNNWYDINEIIGLNGSNLTIKGFTVESKESEEQLTVSLNGYRETNTESIIYLCDIEDKVYNKPHR